MENESASNCLANMTYQVRQFVLNRL